MDKACTNHRVIQWMHKEYIMKKLFFLVALLALLITVVHVSIAQETRTLAASQPYLKGGNGIYLSFSCEEPVQTQSFYLTLTCDPAVSKHAEIYYTLDGNTPTNESLHYTEPILLEKTDAFSVTVVKAVVCLGEEYSPVYTKTYFLCEDTAQLDDMVLVSISSDEHGLFDYDEGILVYGRLYDEYLNSDRVGQLEPWQIPANFRSLRGREYEREAYLEILQGAETVVAQKVGLTLSGIGSAYYDVKSLKVISRKEYDSERPNIEWNFLDSMYADVSKVSQISTFNRLTFRNAGQDRESSFIRANIAYRLANEFGFVGTTYTKPVVVFLNGKYYSIAYAQSSYSREYLSRTFGVPEEQVEVHRYSDATALQSAGVLELINQDLTVEANREQLEAMVDVDALLAYYAFEMYLNNADWPENNVRLWRYTGAPMAGNLFSDGRLRPLLFDFDIAFYTAEQKGEQFKRMLDSESSSGSVLRQLLTCNEYQNQFVNACNALMSGPLQPHHAASIVQEEDQDLLEYGQNSLLWEETAFFRSPERHQAVEEILHFLNTRETAVRPLLEHYLNCNTPYHLHIAPPEGNDVISGIGIQVSGKDQAVHGTFYGSHPLVLTAQAGMGREIVGWLVNGTRIMEDKLIITANMIQDGGVTVQLLTQETSEPAHVWISEISAQGQDDWIELMNPYSEPVQLYGLYLSTNQKNLKKYALPDITMDANSVLLINCKNHAQLNQYITNFNLSEGEQLYLSDESGAIYDQLSVPRMRQGESYGRPSQGDEFVFFMVPTSGAANP